MKTALITGITGQDGSYLAEFLLEKGYDVHGTIRRSSVDFRERIAHLEGTPHFHLHYADLGDSMSVLGVIGKVRPDEIYNLAAQSHVQVSFDSPEFRAISNADLDDYDYRDGRIKIARKYAYLALDDKYKKPSDPDIEEVMQPKEWFIETPKAEKQTKIPESRKPEPVDPAVLKEMIAQNPALEKLVGDFALDINAESDLPF